MEMIGSKSGMLTIISYSHSNNSRFWNARCECGNIRIISTGEINRCRVPVNSCGCYRPRDIDRFLEKVEKSESCWNWKAQVGKLGYGYFRFLGKKQPAHRCSWVLHFGNIPDTLQVCHVCDNRSCVNPEHLFLGTAKDNSDDKFKKGRQRFIEKKITENQKKIIKEMYFSGKSQRLIAKEFNVSKITIWRSIHDKRK